MTRVRGERKKRGHQCTDFQSAGSMTGHFLGFSSSQAIVCVHIDETFSSPSFIPMARVRTRSVCFMNEQGSRRKLDLPFAVCFSLFLSFFLLRLFKMTRTQKEWTNFAKRKTVRRRKRIGPEPMLRYNSIFLVVLAPKSLLIYGILQ